MGLLENEFIKFMGRFDSCPFAVVLNGEEHIIGEGEPDFTVIFHKMPRMPGR